MAAAYAALVSLLNNVEDMRNHRVHSFCFDDNQIQSLLKSVTFLIEFMESYDSCPSCPSKHAAQLLERRITRAAQAAEQVIESHIVDQILGGWTLDGKTRSPRFLLDVEKVNQDMDYVMRKAIKIQQAQRDGVGKLKRSTTYSAPASSSTSEKTTMVGFDELLLELLDVLSGNVSSRLVISIVGTGGVGKTTLAKNAFYHNLTVQHFDICLWATISQEYDVRDILLTLLSPRERSSSNTVGELREILHKKLYGRRYLIVLDDIWSVASWAEMQYWFPDTRDRSRIIVTTRQLDVVDHIGSSRLAISLLDDDKSWDLFCQTAFLGEGCPVELEDVGKNIVSKCKGLPLAIVVVAGHLRKSPRTRESLENVANNMLSILNSAENSELFKILSFSYNYLPVHLKPCFVYMGTFPEDKEIGVTQVINHWIAEGFLKQSKSNNLEETANEYLRDLIDRNLILEGSWDEDWGYETCKVHDLLRELCIKVAEKEMFFYIVGSGQAICRERHVGIREENQHADAVPPLVRSLNWVSYNQSFDLRLCRVEKEKPVPGEVFSGGYHEGDQLNVNVRYRAYIIHNFYKRPTVPSSISLFWHLQILIIVAELERKSWIAPNEIWEMIQLRRLQVRPGVYLPEPPPSDKLEEGRRNLHTLMMVDNLKLSEEVCKRLSNVKELGLRYWSDEVIASTHSPQNLGCLHNLEALRLNFFGDTHNDIFLRMTLPNSLKTLRLQSYTRDWEDVTMMVGSLPNLETLELCHVRGSEWTLVEGQFLRLKSLTLRICSALADWNVESSHFPVLERLVIKGCTSLDEFPSDLGETLRSITLMSSSSMAISAMRMLVEQEEGGNQGISLTIIVIDHGNVEFIKEMLEEEGLSSNNMRFRYFESKIENVYI